MQSDVRVTLYLLKILQHVFKIMNLVSLNSFIIIFLVPDDIILDLVRERLDRPDCRTNGWILEGCPMNLYQIKQLKDLMIVPQVVIAFELSDDEVIDRLSKVRLDPITG